ncbi:carbon starvation CstA family protein [Dolosicoccus paucivorans]|uniref:Carbon starvation protein A n=1 Tax=Dolosicoccus paucivorans TaxID=84521 RepID=A0A1G8LZ19_9LACT|nr:carbon starvation CstA family protein [Dolosicoccus paucivorans]PMB83889.1 carbon starvation protein A [Dolosicoccus paucivorans]PMC58031.1 carbon starvation protein A [Dolosicoccus paucivorans]SDI60906.1 Carbon starvation protein CstA [Dolosicoccus paucivorans]
MITFIVGVALLLAGYFIYGRYVERTFNPDPMRPTPAETLRDGIDYVPMPKWKNAIIQLLNIAGTGPIFGPILGALYGPVGFIWIVLGNIFAGAVHDYMIGMISIRNNGAHLPELTSTYLGKNWKHLVNLFATLLLLLVGTVFVISPASLLQAILPGTIPLKILIIAIFIYYIISTILPIDKALGKVYPWFGAILIISTLAIGVRMLMGAGGAQMQELTLASFSYQHPNNISIFPGLFFTISCGALSGFHATQTPMISRTMRTETEGRFTFYGMMIAEGVIAMIWLAVSLAIYDKIELANTIAQGTPSLVVNEVSVLLLGQTIGTLAIIGVIVLPLSSGLSAFRALRNILADYFNIPQDTLAKILMVTLPLYVVSFFLTFIDFNIIWRYFTWANQVTAVIALLVATRYLYLKSRNYLMTFIPAIFMLFACVIYIMTAEEGFHFPPSTLVYGIGIAISVAMIVGYWISGQKQKAALTPDDPLLQR